MLPQGGGRSTVDVPAPFVGGRALPVSSKVDYEDGPIALSDSSMGSQYQLWTAKIVRDQLFLQASKTGWSGLMFEDAGMQEISFTFDQNALYTCAYVANGVPKMRWYDSSAEAYATTLLPADCINPRVSLDDKRQEFSGESDIILGYVRNKNIYYRVQRERYLIEHLWQENVPAGLVKIGMNRKLRFQFAYEAT